MNAFALRYFVLPLLLIVVTWLPACDEKVDSAVHVVHASQDPAAMAVDADWTYGSLDRPVLLTQRAAGVVLDLAKAQYDGKDWRFRVCNENSYEIAKITLDHDAQRDIYYQTQGVPMAIDRHDVGLVLGVTVDVAEQGHVPLPPMDRAPRLSPAPIDDAPAPGSASEPDEPNFIFSYASEGG